MKCRDINDIKYQPGFIRKGNQADKSISVIGLDTEAYTTGQCFMLATSLGNVFTPEQFPRCFFTRRYRGTNFVAYNLKYDSGALLQNLSQEELQLLREKGKVLYKGYTFKTIGNKCLIISKGKNSIRVYDMLNFYKMSLNMAAQTFLDKKKLDMDTSLFTTGYVKHYWSKIAEYCIKDAELVQELAEKLITMFETFGVKPKKLYSVAYVSYQYFSGKCAHIHVKRYWKDHKEVLKYALESYNGGKFEVTKKGTGHFYEYDIVSAYPFEISNLVDIRTIKIIQSKRYKTDSTYGFLKCKIKIPYGVFSPVAVKRGTVNIFPIGEFEKIITKTEYDYLIKQGCDITIINAYWLITDFPTYPYRFEVQNLVKLKSKFKLAGRKLEYHTIKIFLNSFYGKFIQLIEKEDHFKAGSSWNPIYGSIITANCRTRISEQQALNPFIVAVHTDSIISEQPIEFTNGRQLGDMIPEIEGHGLILGSGIYQVGTKTKLRGFQSKVPLLDLMPEKGKKWDITTFRPYSWREVAHRNLGIDLINRFESMEKHVNLNFDQKRIWLNDYNSYSEVRKRNIDSVPWMIDNTDRL